MTRPKKVALMGACCTKKTTTVTAAGTYEGIQSVPEQAREHFDSVPLAQRHTLEAQMRLAERIIEIERATAEHGEPMLCDRSVLDGIVYLRHEGKAADAERLFEHVSFWLPTYERFILSDPEGIPFKQDTVRIETPEIRASLHAEFVCTFEELEIPYELLGGTPDQRLRRVLEILSDG